MSTHVTVVTRDTWADLDALVAEADAVVHVAGVNRGDDDEVRDGNLRLAERRRRRRACARATRCGSSTRTPSRTATARPTAAGKAARGRGAHGTAGRRPHGRRRPPPQHLRRARTPSATTASSRPSWMPSRAARAPQVADRRVELLHAQDAAQSLIDALTTDDERARAARLRCRRAGGARPAPRVRGELRRRASSPTSRPRSGSTFQLLPGGALPAPLPGPAGAPHRRPWHVRRDGALPRRRGTVEHLHDGARRHPGRALPPRRRSSGSPSSRGTATIALRRMFTRRRHRVRCQRRRALGRRHAGGVGTQHHQHGRRCPRHAVLVARAVPARSGRTPSPTAYSQEASA